MGSDIDVSNGLLEVFRSPASALSPALGCPYGVVAFTALRSDPATCAFAEFTQFNPVAADAAQPDILWHVELVAIIVVHVFTSSVNDAAGISRCFDHFTGSDFLYANLALVGDGMELLGCTKIPLYDDTIAYGKFPHARLLWGCGMLPVWALYSSLIVSPTNLTHSVYRKATLSQ